MRWARSFVLMLLAGLIAGPACPAPPAAPYDYILEGGTVYSGIDSPGQQADVGKSVETLAMVDAANARGLDFSSDVYPYTASSTGIKVLFPAWSLAGNRDQRMARLQDPEARARMKAGLVDKLRQDRGGNDLSRVVIAECKWDNSYNGKSLAQILRYRDRPGRVLRSGQQESSP